MGSAEENGCTAVPPPSTFVIEADHETISSSLGSGNPSEKELGVILEKGDKRTEIEMEDVAFCGKPGSVDNVPVDSFAFEPESESVYSSDEDVGGYLHSKEMTGGGDTEFENYEFNKDVNPLGLSNIAMPLHYFCAGGIQSVVSGILYGCLMGVYGVKGHVYTTSLIIANAPWGTKVVWGFVSDWFPILGYRRKYYCALGWALSVTTCLVLLLFFGDMDKVSPYYCFGEDGYYDEQQVCNPAARDHAFSLTLSMFALILGVTISESAADGLLVECCQEKSLKEKPDPALQVDCFVIRVVGMAGGRLLMAFAFSSKRHLGFFTKDIGLFFILVGISGVGLVNVAAWVLLSQCDRRQAVRVPCCSIGNSSSGYSSWNYNTSFSRCGVANTMFNRLFRVISTKRFLCFFMYQLFAPTIASMEPPSSEMIRRYWAEVQQMQQQCAAMVTSVVYLVILGIVRKLCVERNWRQLVMLSILTSCVGSTTIYIVTSLNVLRSQYFFLVEDVFQHIPLAVNFLVATLACIALAPKGNEATIYGLTTTVHAMAPPIARALSNWFYGSLPLVVLGSTGQQGMLSQPENYVQDTPDFRMLVVIVTLLNGGITALSLAFLPCLPKNNKHAYAMICSTTSPPRPMLGMLVCTFFLVVSIAAFVFIFIAVSPSSCLAVVGGQGC